MKSLYFIQKIMDVWCNFLDAIRPGHPVDYLEGLGMLVICGFLFVAVVEMVSFIFKAMFKKLRGTNYNSLKKTIVIISAIPKYLCYLMLPLVFILFLIVNRKVIWKRIKKGVQALMN